MTLAVTGATGHLGRLVIQQLKEKSPAERIVALVRSPEKAADLGVESRRADYDAPETLRPALEGVDRLLLISGNEIGQRARQHAAVVEAAKAAGVKLMAYTSILRADVSEISLAEEHRATEAAIRGASLPFVLLRNGWYNENYVGGIHGAVASGALIGSVGEGKISSAARADYAAAAVEVLTSDGHEGKTYELAGDAAWSMDELAAEISRQTGRNIPYRNLPEAEYAAALAGLGVPEAFAKALASWDVAASREALFNGERQLSALIGRPTTPIEVTVSEALK